MDEFMKTKRIIPILMVLLMALWGSPHKAAAQIFAVRANALAACTATLNLGVEVALTDRWSLEGALFWNPLRMEDLATSFRAAQLGARYWFTKRRLAPLWVRSSRMSITSSAAAHGAMTDVHGVRVSPAAIRGCSPNGGAWP